MYLYTRVVAILGLDIKASDQLMFFFSIEVWLLLTNLPHSACQ